MFPLNCYLFIEISARFDDMKHLRYYRLIFCCCYSISILTINRCYIYDANRWPWQINFQFNVSLIAFSPFHDLEYVYFHISINGRYVNAAWHPWASYMNNELRSKLNARKKNLKKKSPCNHRADIWCNLIWWLWLQIIACARMTNATFSHYCIFQFENRNHFKHLQCPMLNAQCFDSIPLVSTPQNEALFLNKNS